MLVMVLLLALLLVLPLVGLGLWYWYWLLAIAEDATIGDSFGCFSPLLAAATTWEGGRG